MARYLFSIAVSGNAYTFKELDAMFRDAGFSESTAPELGPQTLILTKY